MRPLDRARDRVADWLRARPAAYAIAKFVHRRWQVLRSNRQRAEAIFRVKYASNAWRGVESRSGTGSDDDQTRVLIAELPPLFRRLGIGSLLDIPCGDFHWMRRMDLTGIRYVGADIVPEVVEANQRFARDGFRFVRLDLVHDRLPRADLVLVRDCLVHLPYVEALHALRNLCRSGSIYLLSTTFPKRTRNSDTVLGGWRPLNLELAPFGFPPPAHVINEHCTEGRGAYADKSLGLWRLTEVEPLVRWA